VTLKSADGSPYDGARGKEEGTMHGILAARGTVRRAVVMGLAARATPRP
jgi:hypothetical protein